MSETAQRDAELLMKEWKVCTLAGPFCMYCLAFGGTRALRLKLVDRSGNRCT